MTTKNEDLIRRVQDALKYDLREMDAIFTPLLNDVLAELTNPGASATKPPAPPPIFLMGETEETEGDGKLTEAEAIEDARARMEANPLPCIADAFVVGERANFKVKDAVSQADECGFHVSEAVGWCPIVVIAKVIMLHITRVFGVEEGTSFEYGHGWVVSFDRELTPDETDKLTAFLGQG